MDPKRKKTSRNGKPPIDKINLWEEFIMTFSNNKSLLSSKKIERFIVFWTFLIITVVYISFNIRTMEAWDFVQIIAVWMAYSGYSTLMSLRDKRLDSEQNKIDGIE